MVKQGLMGAALLGALALAPAVEAKLFKWVDKEGVTHYGETIPPEYADRDTQTLSAKGQLQQRDEKLGPTDKSGKPALTEAQKAEQDAAAEQKRRDSALLNTYSNEKEIDLALNRNLQLLDARVSSFSTMVKSAQETVDMNRKEMEQRTKGGRKAPQSLVDDLANSEARLERLKKDLAQSEQETVNVKARFEA
ncbi:MAG TPA: DUF4124 domain-containing protein, partial [Gallionellaceae bacterium]|nr:DUF4124 domain-containing protein [Gallionellaceae bacterium]